MLWIYIGYWYFHTPFLYFHTNLKFSVIKKTKNSLSLFLSLSPLCLSDCAALLFIPVFSLSSIFFRSLTLFSVHSLPFFFPFLCAPIFIKPNRWVSVLRGDGVGLGLEELRRGSRPGGATVACLGLEQADLGLAWKIWFWFCLLEQTDLRSENFGFVCWRVLLDGELNQWVSVWRGDGVGLRHGSRPGLKILVLALFFAWAGRVAQLISKERERERKKWEEFLVFLMTQNFRLVWKYKNEVWKYQLSYIYLYYNIKPKLFWF